MKKVLIVDDEKEIRDIFEEFFRHELGFESVTLAQDGLVAVTECSLQRFDVITLDNMMPRLKGVDFLTVLRNTPGPNQRCAVIMISANLPELVENISLDQNTFFFSKPIDFRQFTAYVKSVLKKSELYDQ